MSYYMWKIIISEDLYKMLALPSYYIVTNGILSLYVFTLQKRFKRTQLNFVMQGDNCRPLVGSYVNREKTNPIKV